MTKKPILCLDFDGVCHSYTSGWQGADVISDPPVPGLFDFLEAAHEHFKIHVFSARSSQPGGLQAMQAWFTVHHNAWMFSVHPEYLGKYENFSLPDWLIFVTEKPTAFVTIDDRAITFTGLWPQIDDLLTFRPWYQDTSLDIAYKQYRDEEWRHLMSAIADLRSRFFDICPAAKVDGRFFEMMGNPASVIGHVTEFLRTLDVDD